MKFEDEAPFVAEGTCPACHGRLVNRSGVVLAALGFPSAPYGECVPCRRGYRLRKPGPEQEWLGPMVLDTLYLDAIQGPLPPTGATLINTSGPSGPDVFKARMEWQSSWPG